MSVPGLAVNVGAWCNGNTWVSKTFVVSSNLTAPAKFERFAQAERSFLCSSANNSPHFLQRVPEEVNVGVVRDCYVCVSQKLGQNFNITTPVVAIGCERVSEYVISFVWHLRSVAGGLQPESQLVIRTRFRRVSLVVENITDSSR